MSHNSKIQRNAKWRYSSYFNLEYGGEKIKRGFDFRKKIKSERFPLRRQS